MKNIRWGIIGCGDVTEVKSGPAFQKIKGSELIAVMRRQGDLAKDYAHRHNVPAWYDNAELLINDPKVNAIYIATPPSFHKHYTLMAAKAGKPVYVEKPMALNHEECQQMIQACNFTNVRLFVAYYRRALPRFLKVKELIENGAIGQIRHISTQLYRKTFDIDARGEYEWRVDPKIAGCGYFCDLACHTLDLLQYLLGPIEEVYGLKRNNMKLYPAEDMVTAGFQFKSGIIGSGDWIFNHFEDRDETTITGIKGKISFSTFDKHPVRLIYPEKKEQFEIANPLHIQQPLIQLIVNELLGDGKCPSTGKTAAQTNLVMDKILGKNTL